MAPEFPYRVAINSHQYYKEAVCLDVAVNKENGRPYALLKHDDGDIKVLYLDGCYHIERCRSTD